MVRNRRSIEAQAIRNLERMHGEKRFDKKAAWVHRRTPLNPFAISSDFP